MMAIRSSTRTPSTRWSVSHAFSCLCLQSRSMITGLKVILRILMVHTRLRLFLDDVQDDTTRTEQITIILTRCLHRNLWKGVFGQKCSHAGASISVCYGPFCSNFRYTPERRAFVQDVCKGHANKQQKACVCVCVCV